ncbi:MAG TPA: hypothetical protein VGM36_03715 [Rhizomicrobium sp.]|jgi:hypothetical protein
MRKRWKITLWSVGVVALVLLTGGAFVYALFATFYPSVPAAKYPPPHNLAEAQRQDLDYFRNYFDYNKAYSPAAREAAEKLLAGYKTQAGTLSPAAFDLAVSRMIALADNGHSTIFMGPFSRKHNRLPCRLYKFSDGFYVLRARAACVDLLGAKVLAVDGHPIEQVADGMFRYSLGPRNHYDQFKAVFFLESPELLHAAGFATADDRETLHVRARDGSERDKTIVADKPDVNAARVFSDSYLSPAAIDGEAKDWRPLLPRDAKVPLFLRDYAEPFQSVYWADKKTYYVQFRSNSDEPGHPIGAFIDRVKEEIAAEKPKFIVLDLRLDQGGNLTKTASFMKHISDDVQHVYVLTSAWTFSAGNVSLALAKFHGGDKVTIIGEPVGDRMRIWAEGNDMELPNSKLDIGFATGLHDYRKSCWGEPGCFWVMYFYPMQLKSWMPDARVPYTFADYTALSDPMLDRALLMAMKN